MSATSRWRRVALALLLAIAGAGAGDATAADAVASDVAASEAGASELAVSEEPVRARLVCDRVAIEAGGPARLGILFDIDPGWHLFWDGCNNTGYPIHARPDFPEGITAGELVWPAPERLVSPGDILDHVYAKQVLLILPVEVTEDLEPGASVALSCALEWVACREACVIGGADVSLRLSVVARDAAAPSKYAALFEETRARVPGVPAPGVAPYSTRWEGDTLILEADGAKSMAFFPRSGCEALVNPLIDCSADGSRLAMRIHPANQTSDSVRGVLEITSQDAAMSRFVALKLPLCNSNVTR